ncbi:phosphoglycerate mutase [Teratosphaeria destructans]|uniref:Phosphoglycerate mutase n=1 Tax=Teratosphaeria destructans TaxID=418781 RepID=A0A9W7SM43_9PEZI|nr:phosphoglycerate mutase [Teratosphaeria destructans]
MQGETEWTINGRYTGRTELDLTSNGKVQVLGTGNLLVGPGRLIDPERLARIFVSPRKRACTTFQLLLGSSLSLDDPKVSVTEEIAEWDYGDYEGLLTSEIRIKRAAKGLDHDSPWDIWRDGCEGGEYVLTPQPLSHLRGLTIHTVGRRSKPPQGWMVSSPRYTISSAHTCTARRQSMSSW